MIFDLIISSYKDPLHFGRYNERNIIAFLPRKIYLKTHFKVPKIRQLLQVYVGENSFGTVLILNMVFPRQTGIWVTQTIKRAHHCLSFYFWVFISYGMLWWMFFSVLFKVFDTVCIFLKFYLSKTSADIDAMAMHSKLHLVLTKLEMTIQLRQH